MRTLPFVEPLNATSYDGVYVKAWLASDEDAKRRIWKMTLRTDGSRGEMVYQAPLDLGKAMDDVNVKEGKDVIEKWATILVPFDTFQLVRGPRLVPDGPKLDVSGGLYQVGLTMSKFMMASNTTELENFRPGFFEVHIQKIGFYTTNDAPMGESTNVLPNTLSKEEANKKRPLALKLLLPIAKIFFSEQANRRRSAMKILQQKRKLSRVKAILFGIRLRRKNMGLILSIIKTCGILSVDSFRAVIGSVLRIVLVYPLNFAGVLIRTLKKCLGMKVKVPLRE